MKFKNLISSAFTTVSEYFIGAIALLAIFILLIEQSGFFASYAKIFRYTNFSILLLFLLDLILRFVFSKSKTIFFKHNWLSLIIFIPFLQFIRGIETLPFSIILFQIVAVSMLVSRLRKANSFVSLLNLEPLQLMVISFGMAILVGGILLMLPAATLSGEKTTLVDAIFTATSAVCVTGLTVQNTATHFSLFGQLVILILIQLGGLGIMTFSVSLALMAKNKLALRQQAAMQNILDQDTLIQTHSLISFIFLMTLGIELIGAIILAWLWQSQLGGLANSIYPAIFHSVSAFCNAGFSTFTDNLLIFARDPATSGVIALLLILGGLGFPVIYDVKEYFKKRRQKHQVARLKLQTRIVLVSSILLIVVGSVLFFLLERTNTLQGLDLYQQITVSVFQAITPRTAGFNTWDIATFSPLTLFIMIILMFIGASPGSTGGGIKTTTFSVIWMSIWSMFKGRDEIRLKGRTLPKLVVEKAAQLIVLSITIVIIVTGLLMLVEQRPFMDILFEVVSAFSTVGLSTGITPLLTTPGKSIIIVLMYIGRLGPLTLGYALIKKRKRVQYTYPEERVMVG